MEHFDNHKNKIMKAPKTIPGFACILISSALFAQSPANPGHFINPPKAEAFVENKGQLRSGSGLQIPNSSSDVKYYTHTGGVNVFCRPGMLSFIFRKVESAN